MAPADGAVIRKLRPTRRTEMDEFAFALHHVTIAYPQRIERRPQALVEGVEIDPPQPRERPRDLAGGDKIRVDFIGDGENGIAPDVLEIQKALRRYLQRIENSSDLRILVAAPLSHHARSVSRSRRCTFIVPIVRMTHSGSRADGWQNLPQRATHPLWNGQCFPLPVQRSCPSPRISSAAMKA